MTAKLPIDAAHAADLLALLEAQASPPHCTIRREQAIALTLLLERCEIDPSTAIAGVELPSRGRDACEQCGIYTGAHYCSAIDCNETGRGVVLCEPCCLKWDRHAHQGSRPLDG